MVTPPVDLSDTLVSVLSPSGLRRGVLRETKDKKRFAEVWIGDRLEAIKDVSKDHDEFYTQRMGLYLYSSDMLVPSLDLQISGFSQRHSFLSPSLPLRLPSYTARNKRSPTSMAKSRSRLCVSCLTLVNNTTVNDTQGYFFW